MNVNTRLIFNRFITSILGNILKGVLTITTMILLARMLSVETYGRFSYILYTLISLRLFFDLGIPSAIFTFLSQAKRSNVFRNLIFIWSGFAISLQILLLVLLPLEYINYIWPGEEVRLIVYAALGIFIRYGVWSLAAQVGESNRSTKAVHIINNLCLLSHLILICILYYLDSLSLSMIFLSMGVIWSIGSIFSIKLYFEKNNKESLISSSPLEFKTFMVYWLPLVPWTILSASVEIFDRWILNSSGGLEEQAFFNVAFQFSAIILLITTSILRIYWKEISELTYHNQFEKLKMFTSRILLYITYFCLILAIFFIYWSEPIIALLLGSDYSEATNAFSVLMVYPILQTYIQILGVLMLATGLSTRYSIVNIIWILISLFSSYYIFNFGYLFNIEIITSSTIAIKLVTLALLQCIFFTIAIRRFLYTNDLIKIILATVIFVFGAYFAKILTANVIFQNNVILEILFGGILYILFIMGLLGIFLNFFEAQSGDFDNLKKKLKFFFN